MQVPEGWKLVPVEPTWEMILAGGTWTCEAIYAAMLAAAPNPPAEAIPSNPGELKGEPVQATQQLTPLEKLRAMIRNDWYACSFQSMGQYRDALLKASKPEIAAPASPSHPDDAAVRQGECAVIEALLDVALKAWSAMDDSEEQEGMDLISIEKVDALALSDAIDVLEALPDDQPGYVMGAAAKARWALRRLLPPVSADIPADEGKTS